MSVSGGRQHRRTGDSIIWSPHKATQRLFLCSSESQLKLFEWTGQDYQPDNATVNQVKAVAIHTSASIIKSVSWCQATDLSTIVATGNAVGKVSLMNLASFAVINGSLLISNAAKSLINKKERKSLDVDVLHSYQSLLDNHSNMPICSDYIPTNSRSCNTVAFSITNPHLLLAGFDKVRVDSCIYVWDICRPQIDASRQNTMSVEYTSSLNLPSLHKPISQYGTSEGVTSMCWMNEHAARFVAGMSLRYIRSYDCRVDSSQGPAFSIGTKAIHGLMADPFSTNRFASFGDDGVIRIWDERKLTDPILLLNPDFRSGISSISWSPSRPGLINCSGRDSSTMKFWQIHDVFKDKSTGTLVPTFTPKDNVASQLASTDWGNIPPTLSRTEPLGTGQTAAVPTSGLPSRGNDWGNVPQEQADLTERVPFLWKMQTVRSSNESISLFSWIPHQRRQILYVTTRSNEGIFEVSKLPTLPQSSFSPCGQITVSCDSLVSIWGADLDICTQVTQTDIAELMRSRVLEGYGLNCQENISLCKDDLILSSLWKFMDIVLAEESANAYCLSVDTDLQSTDREPRELADRSATKPLAKNGIMGMLALVSQREIGTVGGQFANTHSISGQGVGKVSALRLCGYDIDFEASNTENSPDGAYERAAGVSLFTSGNLDGSIECLASAPDERLQLVAAALAGAVASRIYTSSASGLQGKDIFKSLGADLANPYLRALFSFASADGDWTCILSANDLPLADRVAVAIRFLGDEELSSYLEELSNHVISEGRIDGLLLTGFGKSGINLIENFVNRTSDVQTASLIIATCGLDLALDERVESWTELYRTLLDRWQLYHERARFDIRRRKTAMQIASLKRPNVLLGRASLSAADRIPPQVHVRCNFCSQPISTIQLPRRNTQPTGMLAARVQRHKLTACQHCGKPLPRCSICCQSMGGTVETGHSKNTVTSEQAGFNSVSNSQEQTATMINSWFTWCQSCKHGGHTGHILDWFKGHTMCPVADCTCQCLH
ncbi:hypothetical protein BASA84_000517 [Batrachochytrium salamandrivorans]|nr:hypothetical protein BASA84_000517 [Batrachochytrium salamandrivorans]